MTKSTYWLSVAGATVIGLTVGGLFGWFVRGGWTAEWVTAAGTWIGAGATVATIVWAVLSFRHEQRTERRRVEKIRQRGLSRQEREAGQVMFRCHGGGRSGQKKQLRVGITNGTSKPIEVRGVEVVEPAAAFHRTYFQSPFVVGSGDTWASTATNIRMEVEYPEGQEFDYRAELPESVLHYRIDGIAWRRNPTGHPERCDE